MRTKSLNLQLEWFFYYSNSKIVPHVKNTLMKCMAQFVNIFQYIEVLTIQHIHPWTLDFLCYFPWVFHVIIYESSNIFIL